jgi:hypothetical protein
MGRAARTFTFAGTGFQRSRLDPESQSLVATLHHPGAATGSSTRHRRVAKRGQNDTPTRMPTPRTMTSRSARLAASLIALCAAVGVGFGFSAVFGRTGSVPLTAWIMAAYFTNLTGLLVLAVFGGIALRVPALAQPRLVATTVLATLLVGLVQRLLLYGVRTLRGGDLVGDILLHQVLPVLVPLFWLAFVPKGRLAGRDLVLFASYPLIYLGYTLLRGAYDALPLPVPRCGEDRLGSGRDLCRGDCGGLPRRRMGAGAPRPAPRAAQGRGGMNRYPSNRVAISPGPKIRNSPAGKSAGSTRPPTRSR